MVKLRYYWVVTYQDGTTYSQYNSDGTENLWKEVNQDNVVRVSWKEFSLVLSNKVEISTKWSVLPKTHSLNVETTDDIFIVRRNHIDFNAWGEKGHRIEYILGKNKDEIIKL